MDTTPAPQEAQPVEEWRTVSVRLRVPVAETIDREAEKSGTDRSEVIRRALAHYFGWASR